MIVPVRLVSKNPNELHEYMSCFVLSFLRCLKSLPNIIECPLKIPIVLSFVLSCINSLSFMKEISSMTRILQFPPVNFLFSRNSFWPYPWGLNIRSIPKCWSYQSCVCSVEERGICPSDANACWKDSKMSLLLWLHWFFHPPHSTGFNSFLSDGVVTASSTSDPFLLPSFEASIIYSLIMLCWSPVSSS